MKIYSLNLVSVYRGYTLIVFMTQGYFTAKRLRTTDLEQRKKLFTKRQKFKLKTLNNPTLQNMTYASVTIIVLGNRIYA